VKRNPIIALILAAAACAVFAGARPRPDLQSAAPGPAALMPKLPDWKPTEETRRFSTESLFEYIDGAAEAYIGYGFRELAVGEFARTGTKTTVTAEIYDMGSGLNAFGIYGAERYPESRFLPIGVQGYYEEGTLNFLAGRYYVKLFCFEGGEKAEEILTLFARAIAAGVGGAGGFPARLSAFPSEGRVANSERFLRQSVMGLKFLNNGYVANYRTDGREFDAYLIDCTSETEAASAMKQLSAHFGGSGKTISPTAGGFRARDPYLKNVHAVRTGAVLCLVTRLENGQDAFADGFLASMSAAVSKR
jgi:hypothetical protein